MLLMNSSGSLDLRTTNTSSTSEGGMRNWRNGGACEKQQGLRGGTMTMSRMSHIYIY